MMRRRGSWQLRGFMAVLTTALAACHGAASKGPAIASRTQSPHTDARPLGGSTTTQPTSLPDEASALPNRQPGPAPEDDPPFVTTSKELAKFHRALYELERGRRKEHVRVLWLGDSHGQADFWSGQLRKLFQDRFGRAGPGFVHLGYKNYRHDGIKLDIAGKWRMRPKKPVDAKRQADGIFGLGGLMMSGYADMPRVELALTDAVAGKSVRYDVCYRFLEPDDALAISIDGERETTRFAKDETLGAVAHASLVASTKEPFVVRPIGRTDLCGVVAESDPSTNPGVVVDTLAINGARYGTALAWDEAAWVSEVARRNPSLVILEYGTNEAGDLNPAFTKVGKQVGELLGRVRKAAPDVECVVVSPTDRADAEANVSLMRRTILEAAKKEGCYVFDVWDIFGGEGAFARLSEEADAKVSNDKIHLTIRGYRELGETMFGALLGGYGQKVIARQTSP